MVAIKDITVYDPKLEGIDFSLVKRIEEINCNAGVRLLDGLYDAVSKSIVERYEDHQDMTLSIFLYSQIGWFTDGYFRKHPNVFAVLFMDGRFYSQYNQKEYSEVELETIAQETGSIPFMFTREINLG